MWISATVSKKLSSCIFWPPIRPMFNPLRCLRYPLVKLCIAHVYTNSTKGHSDYGSTTPNTPLLWTNAVLIMRIAFSYPNDNAKLKLQNHVICLWLPRIRALSIQSNRPMFDVARTCATTTKINKPVPPIGFRRDHHTLLLSSGTLALN